MNSDSTGNGGQRRDEPLSFAAPAPARKPGGSGFVGGVVAAAVAVGLIYGMVSLMPGASPAAQAGVPSDRERDPAPDRAAAPGDAGRSRTPGVRAAQSPRPGRAGTAAASGAESAPAGRPRRRRRRCAPRRAEFIAVRPFLQMPIAPAAELLPGYLPAFRPPDLLIYPIGASPQSVASALSDLDIPVCVVDEPSLADALVRFDAGAPGFQLVPPGLPAAASTATVLPPAAVGGGGGLNPILPTLVAVGKALAATAAAGVVSSTIANTVPASNPRYVNTSEPGFVDQNENQGPRTESLRARHTRILRDTTAEATGLRVQPPLAIIGRGNQQAFRLETRDAQGNWHPLAARDGTDLSLVGSRQAFVQNRAAANIVAVPAAAPDTLDGSRTLIQATYRLPNGKVLRANALAIAWMGE